MRWSNEGRRGKSNLTHSLLLPIYSMCVCVSDIVSLYPYVRMSVNGTECMCLFVYVYWKERNSFRFLPLSFATLEIFRSDPQMRGLIYIKIGERVFSIHMIERHTKNNNILNSQDRIRKNWRTLCSSELSIPELSNLTDTVIFLTSYMFMLPLYYIHQC